MTHATFTNAQLSLEKAASPVLLNRHDGARFRDKVYETVQHYVSVASSMKDAVPQWFKLCKEAFEKGIDTTQLAELASLRTAYELQMSGEDVSELISRIHILCFSHALGDGKRGIAHDWTKFRQRLFSEHELPSATDWELFQLAMIPTECSTTSNRVSLLINTKEYLLKHARTGRGIVDIFEELQRDLNGYLQDIDISDIKARCLENAIIDSQPKELVDKLDVILWRHRGPSGASRCEAIRDFVIQHRSEFTNSLLPRDAREKGHSKPKGKRGDNKSRRFRITTSEMPVTMARREPRVLLGGRGPAVSPWCLGTMTWGRQTNEQEAHAQLELALARGVNFVDTAEIYPLPCTVEVHGRAEQILGSWLKANPARRGELVVATKVVGFMKNTFVVAGRDPEHGHLAAGWPERPPKSMARLDRAQIHSACAASLARLGTTYIDVLYLHWPDRYVPMFGSRLYDPHRAREGAVSFVETVAAIGELIASGAVRAWGLSNETAFGVCELCHECDRQGVARPVAIQNQFSMLDRSFETDSLAEACAPQHYSLSLVAFSPLAGGALTGKYASGPSAPPADSRFALFTKFRDQFFGERVQAAVDAYMALLGPGEPGEGRSLTDVALRWPRTRPCLADGCVLLGASSAAQLAANLDSVQALSQEEVQHQEKFLPPLLCRAIDAVYLRHKDPLNGL